MGRKKEKKIREDDVGKQKGHEVGNPQEPLRNRPVSSFTLDLALTRRQFSSK
jgi:hypothetical protein